MSANSGLRRLSRQGISRNAVLLSKPKSIPRNANSWQIGFSKGLGESRHAGDGLEEELELWVLGLPCSAI
jgi:hypothetical protein